MITIDDIIRDSEPHPMLDGGRQTIYDRGDLRISIVGGRTGLYGDFENTFEVAIFTKKPHSFISGVLYPEYAEESGDTLPWLSKEKTLRVVNELMNRKGSGS